MVRVFLNCVLCASFALCASLLAAPTPEQLAQLPPPANHQVDFGKEIKPIFDASCIRCHGHGREKGGLRLDTRDTFLKGGDSGPAVIPGKSAESLLISLVQGFDPDEVMPKKGSRLTRDQIALLRAWIDQGVQWDPGISLGRVTPQNLARRDPPLPPGKADANPIDRLLQPYFTSHNIKPGKPVSDRVFARRVYLDIVGLLPPPDKLDSFIKDSRPDKRKRLVQKLLADNRNYTEHWLSFWNDMLRNDYKGTGYIDGGRKQITGWLYSALLTNMPYNQFVAELIDPSPASEGFTKGIVWRGVVNASQTPQMQAAQSICQVFMGVNLKCASCHDSFVNDLTLSDAYGLAGVYADGPLEMVLCDKPTGKKANLHFIYPELGEIDQNADKPARLKRLADIIAGPQDGRVTRTLVNRFWQRLFGRGLVEPVDEMEKAAWSPDLLDWLAEDFEKHSYDVKFLLERILTSQAYQMPSSDSTAATQNKDYVFTGPYVRRMDAEQFRDAVTALTGVGYATPAADVAATPSESKKFSPPGTLRWIWNDKAAAEKAKPEHVYFRKKIVLDSTPTDATAVVICDNSFKLFVNGKAVGSGNDFKNAFLFDLRPFLKTGENLFAINALNATPLNKEPDPNKITPESYNPAGLLFYARLRAGAKSRNTNDLVSDNSWVWSTTPGDKWQSTAYSDTNWQAAVVLGEMTMQPWRVSRDYIRTKLATFYPGHTRAALVAADPLTTALGRPNREQVVTTRPPEATTLQALELTNGESLADICKRGAANILADKNMPKSKLVPVLFAKALGREPRGNEAQLASELLAGGDTSAGVQDLLWSLAMLPEFQLIY